MYISSGLHWGCALFCQRGLFSPAPGRNFHYATIFWYMVWSDYWEYKNIKWPTHPKFTKADKNSQRKIGANGISQIAKICWKKWETAMKNTYTQKQKKPANFSPKLKYTKKAKKNLPHFPPDPIDTKIKKDYIFWFHAIFFLYWSDGNFDNSQTN